TGQLDDAAFLGCLDLSRGTGALDTLAADEHYPAFVWLEGDAVEDARGLEEHWRPGFLGRDSRRQAEEEHEDGGKQAGHGDLHRGRVGWCKQGHWLRLHCQAYRAHLRGPATGGRPP